MNDAEFHAEVARALRGFFPALTIEGAQAAATSARPLLTVSGTYTPYGAAFRKGETNFEIRTRSGEGAEAAAAHGELVSDLMRLLVEDASDLLTAIAESETCEALLLAPRSVVAEIDGEDLRTEILVTAAWRFV